MSDSDSDNDTDKKVTAPIQSPSPIVKQCFETGLRGDILVELPDGVRRPLISGMLALHSKFFAAILESRDEAKEKEDCIPYASSDTKVDNAVALCMLESMYQHTMVWPEFDKIDVDKTIISIGWEAIRLQLDESLSHQIIERLLTVFVTEHNISDLLQLLSNVVYNGPKNDARQSCTEVIQKFHSYMQKNKPISIPVSMSPKLLNQLFADTKVSININCWLPALTEYCLTHNPPIDISLMEPHLNARLQHLTSAYSLVEFIRIAPIAMKQRFGSMIATTINFLKKGIPLLSVEDIKSSFTIAPLFDLKRIRTAVATRTTVSTVDVDAATVALGEFKGNRVDMAAASPAITDSKTAAAALTELRDVCQPFSWQIEIKSKLMKWARVAFIERTPIWFAWRVNRISPILLGNSNIQGKAAEVGVQWKDGDWVVLGISTEELKHCVVASKIGSSIPQTMIEKGLQLSDLRDLVRLEWDKYNDEDLFVWGDAELIQFMPPLGSHTDTAAPSTHPSAASALACKCHTTVAIASSVPDKSSTTNSVVRRSKNKRSTAASVSDDEEPPTKVNKAAKGKSVRRSPRFAK